MLVPRINPDEFGPGYMIRLGIINGLKTFRTTRVFISSNLQEDNNDHDLIPLHLARILNMDIEKYCQQHTLLPVLRGITNVEDTVPHGCMKYPFSIKRYGHFGVGQTIKFCKECIKEDMDYLGYSYYRRSHQLPGGTRCIKHENKGQLHSVSVELFCNPSDAVNVSVPDSDFSNDPVIERYFAILDGVCDFKRPIDPNKFVGQLQEMAKQRKLRWGANGKNILFSDYLVNILPIDWVSLIIPSIRGKKRNVRFPSLDGVLSAQQKPSKTVIYILALALLFDDADEVLTLLEQSLPLAPKSILSMKENDEKWEQYNLEKEFIENNGCCEKISRKLGVDSEQLRNRLRKEGFPLFGNKSKKFMNAYDMFLNGATLYEASMKSGLEIQQFEIFVRKMCIKFIPKKAFDTQHTYIGTVQ